MKFIFREEKSIAKLNSDKKSVFIIRFFGFFSLFLVIISLTGFQNNTNGRIIRYTEDVKDTIYIYDTVVYYDTTVVYDTVYVSEKEYKSIFKDSILNLTEKTKFGKIVLQDSNYLLIKKDNKYRRKKINLFSFDLFYAPLYSFQTFNSDYIYGDVSAADRNAINPSIGINTGINFNYRKKNNIYTGGINLTNFRTNFSALSLSYKIDTVPKMHFIQKKEIYIDSIALINIDTLLATGDTLYYYYKDTTYSTYIDTTIVSEPDTSNVFKSMFAKDSYTYIEIPLFFSHSFFTPDFTLSPEFGFITSFFIDSKGKIVSLTNLYQTSDLKNEPKVAYVNLSIYAGVKVNYYLNDKLDFVTSAYFRRNINSIYRDYPLISHFNSFGISFGVRYKLLF